MLAGSPGHIRKVGGRTAGRFVHPSSAGRRDIRKGWGRHLERPRRGRHLLTPGNQVERRAAPAPTTRNARSHPIRNVAIIALVVPGLFATVALPAYAYSPETVDGSSATSAVAQLREDEAQTVQVADVAVAAAARDGYDTVSAAELRRAAQKAAFAAYSGPTARDYLANPPYPTFSL